MSSIDMRLSSDMSTKLETRSPIPIKPKQASKNKAPTLPVHAKAATEHIISSYPCRPQGCFICGVKYCKLVTHRVANLEVLKRVSKSGSDKSSYKKRPIPKVEEISNYDLSTFFLAPTVSDEFLEAFAPFPVKGAKRASIIHFHDFFKAQGANMHDTYRSLAFDNAYLPKLFPAAMQNPALCMSIVAMAATYAAVHGRSLTKPDPELLTIYSQCFEVLRRQIEQEDQPSVSEPSIMAAINLVMCCGVGFHDRDAALTHWNGVTAMFSRASRTSYSGPLITFFTHLEHWMTLMTGTQLRETPWVDAVPHEHPPAEIYGGGLQRLFTSPMTTSSQSELLTSCLNSCRATEMLEVYTQDSRLGAPDAPFFTYSLYLRGIVSQQNARVFAEFASTNSLEECISIVANIFYLSVLRMTPWRAPLQHLCTKLRLAVANYELTPSALVFAPCSSTVDEGYSDEEGVSTIVSDAYIWMLFMCACGAHLGQDQDSFDWALQRLHDLHLDKLGGDGEDWRASVQKRLHSFCWSDKFLSVRFEKICSALELPKA